MYIVKTSFRAFLIALLPLLFVHGVLFAMALLGTQTTPPMIALPSPDLAFGMLMLRVALDATGLILGHFVCRGLGAGSRAAYGLAGGLAAMAGYAHAIQQGLTLLPPYEGAIVTAGILPALAGLVAGFLYSQFAGRESLHPAGAEPSDVTPAPTPAPPVAFEGPVQVRTSIAAMFFASFIPAALLSVLFFTLTYGLVSGIQDAPNEPLKFNWSRQIMALAVPAQMFLTTAIVTFIPSGIFVALAHAVARALRRTDGLSYAGIGALVGIAFGIALVPFGGWPAFPFTGVSFLLLPLAVFGAIVMAVYRRFAGLEPQPLPEAVLATGAETLVPADHPSRRAHAVVLNG